MELGMVAMSIKVTFIGTGESHFVARVKKGALRRLSNIYNKRLVKLLVELT